MEKIPPRRRKSRAAAHSRGARRAGTEVAGAARRVALGILSEMERGKPLERLAEDRLARSSLDSRDRALAVHLIQGTVRQRKYLDWVIAQYLSGTLEELPVPIRNALRLAFYQLLYLDRIPERAIVDEHVRLAAEFGHRGTAGLVNAVLRSFLRAGRRIAPPTGMDPVEEISIETSHPEWMIRRWVARFGLEETRRLAAANNRVPSLSLRVNRLRTTPDRLRERLLKAGIDSRPGALNSWVLHVQGPAAVQDVPGLEDGWFQVQDESSSLIGLMAAPEPGETVLDLCCGVGGKTTHVAELMEDAGVVVGADLTRWRLEKLRDNCRRLGIGSVRAVRADVTRPCARPVDLVLLDAPCSGTGVLARRADARWRQSESDLPRLAALQRSMLEAAALQVRAGGRLVYSVCSLEPEECEDVVRWFLETFPAFRIDSTPSGFPEDGVEPSGMLRVFPDVTGRDGMFAARMRKENS